jgi:hypothetical protein
MANLRLIQGRHSVLGRLARSSCGGCANEQFWRYVDLQTIGKSSGIDRFPAHPCPSRDIARTLPGGFDPSASAKTAKVHFTSKQEWCTESKPLMFVRSVLPSRVKCTPHSACSCLTIVASRAGPTEIHLTGTPISSSTRTTYACALLGRSSNALTSEMSHRHPGRCS